MDRAYQSGAAVSAPSAPASPSTGYPTAGNPGSGTPATTPGPYWYHMIMEELMAVISAAGIEPAQGNLTQLLTALRSAGVFQTAPQFDNDTSVATTGFVQRALGNFAAANSFAQDETLSVAKTGQYLLPNSTTITRVYLPIASAAGFTIGSRGEAYHIQNTAPQPIAVTPQSTDSIFISGASLGAGVALALPVGSEVTLVRISGTAWAAFGTGALRGSADFTANLAANGYQKLPSGLIIQWATFTTNASGLTNWTFPQAFPTAMLHVEATLQASTSIIGTPIVNRGAATLTTVPVGMSNNASGWLALPLSVVAIGY